MTSKELIIRLYHYLYSTHYPIVPNSYIYDWESDMLAINKINGYVTEYEIKISRSDFKNDFTKSKKHQLISDTYSYNFNSKFVPNYFYYVTPPGLIDKIELPDYAGLIEIGIMKPRIVKKAPKLHKLKAVEVDIKLEYNLLKKLYYKFWKIYNERKP